MKVLYDVYKLQMYLLSKIRFNKNEKKTLIPMSQFEKASRNLKPIFSFLLSFMQKSN